MNASTTTTGPIRTLARLTFGNRASAVYLGLVGATVAVAAAQPLFTTDADASFIWVWPAVSTLPTFGFVAWLGEAGWGGDAPSWFFLGGIALSALVQSLALGTALRALRGRRRHHAPTAG